MTHHALFGRLAGQYDLHTPPDHYQHDHAFVLEIARERCPGAERLLDVGCGTGVFLERARRAGFTVLGIDASPEMVRQATRRVGPDIAHVARMEALVDKACYDVIVALSWTLNYVSSDRDLFDVIARIARALRPAGVVVLQVAHATNASGDVFMDSEPDPDDHTQHVTLLYRFRTASETSLTADYVYVRPHTKELTFETHVLRAADATLVARACTDAGLCNVDVFDTWRREPFTSSVSPFIIASRP